LMVGAIVTIKPSWPRRKIRVLVLQYFKVPMEPISWIRYVVTEAPHVLLQETPFGIIRREMKLTRMFLLFHSGKTSTLLRLGWVTQTVLFERDITKDTLLPITQSSGTCTIVSYAKLVYRWLYSRSVSDFIAYKRCVQPKRG